MDKIIVKACLCGLRSREENPNIPITPQEIADEAVRCFNAGASIVHLHARAPDGGISYDPAWYTQADALIRSRCDLVLNYSTFRTSNEPVETVTRYLREVPNPVEMISLNLGQNVSWVKDKVSGERHTVIFPDSYEDIRAILDVCYSRGTLPEPASQDVGMLSNAFHLMQEGIIRQSHYFLVEPISRWGDGRQAIPGTPRSYFYLTDTIKERYPDATWIAHGGEMETFTIVALAITTGAHVRVGFEDSPSLPNNPQPRSNAEFVDWAVTMARLQGREPATPSEAREILKLLPPPA